MAQIDPFARMVIKATFALAILEVVGIFGPIARWISAVRLTVGSATVSAANLLAFAVVAIVGVLLMRVLRVVMERLIYPSVGMTEGRRHATTIAVNYSVAVLVAGFSLVALGIDLRALAVFAGAIGVGIGFGLQDFAKNLISGFVLLFGRIVEKGDLVTVADKYLGTVEEIGGRLVRIRTRDNTDLVIPASEVVGSAIVNWTHGDSRVRIHVEVGVSYSSDANAVRDALLAAAKRSPEVLDQPAPDVWFVEFGDSAIVFDLLVWTDAKKTTPQMLRGRLMFHIWDALKEAGIEIPFPQRDLHLRSVAPEAAATLLGGTDDSAAGEPGEPVSKGRSGSLSE